MSDPDPIIATIDQWHSLLRGDSSGGMEELLHPDVVFWSPVLFAPQRGRDLTMMYLGAAYEVFPGDTASDDADSGAAESGASGSTSSFHYTKHVLDGHHAVLEFETVMGDTVVNGVDIITCDDDGLIVEFKVMIRPHRAVETVRERMGAMIASMKAEG